MSKRIVIALGGNALGNTLPEQAEAVKITARAIVDLIEDGNQVVVAHGNGPQVGIINNAMAALQKEDPNQGPTPLSVCGAMSQAYIGYDLQNAFREELLNRGICNMPVCSIVTQVEVDPADPAFQNPSKPIGKFMTKSEAADYADKTGYLVKEDAGRGWRRYVASPSPSTSSRPALSGPQRGRAPGHLLRRRRHPRLPHRAQPPEGRGGGHRQGLRLGAPGGAAGRGYAHHPHRRGEGGHQLPHGERAVALLP